jgi:hypothetical protein
MCEEHLDATMDGEDFMVFGEEADPLPSAKTVEKETQHE